MKCCAVGEQKLRYKLLDWDKIKKDIDIEQYFLFKMGAVYSFDKYKRAYVKKGSDGTSQEIIRFFHHQTTRVKMYYSILNQDSGDIIQFVKKRILGSENSLASEVNAEISSYLGYVHNYERKTETISKKIIVSRIPYLPKGIVANDINLHLQYLLQHRKFDISTINSLVFRNVLFDYSLNGVSSLAYYLKDIHGNIVGINRIQTAQGVYFNKKWFDKQSNNSIGFTFSELIGDTETLSIFESLFDAMSYWEIYSPQNTQLVATNGELGFSKAKLLVQYFREKKFKKIRLSNDNDIAGRYFNLNILGNIIPIFSAITKTGNYIKMDIVSVNESDSKLKTLLNFFKKADIQKIKYEEGSTHLYSQEEINGVPKISLFIQNTTESIDFFIHLYISIFNLEEIVEIALSTSKDYNEDLINHKNGQERYH